MDRLGSISKKSDPSIRFAVLCDKNVATFYFFAPWRAVGFVQHLRAVEIGHAVVGQANAAANLSLLFDNKAKISQSCRRFCGSATGA